jgi:hypothetical protein
MEVLPFFSDHIQPPPGIEMYFKLQSFCIHHVSHSENDMGKSHHQFCCQPGWSTPAMKNGEMSCSQEVGYLLDDLINEACQVATWKAAIN